MNQQDVAQQKQHNPQVQAKQVSPPQSINIQQSDQQKILPQDLLQSSLAEITRQTIRERNQASLFIERLSMSRSTLVSRPAYNTKLTQVFNSQLSRFNYYNKRYRHEMGKVEEQAELSKSKTIASEVFWISARRKQSRMESLQKKVKNIEDRLIKVEQMLSSNKK